MVITQRIYIGEDSSFYTEVDSMDNEGRIILNSVFKNSDKKLWSTEFSYDSVNNRTKKEDKHDYTRHPFPKKETLLYYYGKTDHLESLARLDSTGVVEFIEAKVDTKGNPIELTRSQSLRFVSEKAVYFYGDNSVIITKFSTNGQPFQADTFAIDLSKPRLLRKNFETFNKNGDIIKKKSFYFSLPPSTIECEYKYDKAQNWTECRIYELTNEGSKLTRKLTGVVKRQFVYK